MTEYNQQNQRVEKQYNIAGSHIDQIGDRYGLSVEEVALLVVELRFC